ncbi:hypothetical protein JAAARDRAFT_32792 [Jaapia argillacea MUCL 33604]|uniref:Uncharacterized protein n=1 Tax=Jaapia argillacea MUCL 33604 TaxID=933084 RepID=A0A067Q2N4_9AGAM|nr:hypothetical protein JAAARDRAFT_32792 [Jaapia argillacea MUCL 33604]
MESTSFSWNTGFATPTKPTSGWTSSWRFDTPGSNTSSFATPKSVASPSIYGTPLGKYTNDTPIKLKSSKASQGSPRGYFAFPPPGSPDPSGATRHTPSTGTLPRNDGGSSRLEDATPQLHSRDDKAPSEAPPVSSDSPRRTTRIQRESDLASLGEYEWVRTGGVLRDASGKRDLARTQAIREELRIREEERKVRESWEGYEKNWSEFVQVLGGGESVGGLTFQDIPWPVRVSPRTVEELKAVSIKEFLLSPLSLRPGTPKADPQELLAGEQAPPPSRSLTPVPTTKKEIIRSSLLRWHPDKLDGLGLWVKVRDDEKDLVREGVGLVTRTIREI